MNRVPRVLTAVIGLLSFLSVAQHWFRVDALANERGIDALSIAGNANIRADIGGIFLGIGILALIAAKTKSQTWMMATIIIVGSAFVGRLLSLIIDGSGPGVIPPIIIEAVVIAIFTWTWKSFGKAPEGL